MAEHVDTTGELAEDNAAARSAAAPHVLSVDLPGIWSDPMAASRNRAKAARLTAASALGLVTVLVGAVPAAANPGSFSQAPPAGDEPSCSFTLSAPQLTEVPGGAKAVTATYAASACTGNAQPVFVTVCVESPSGRSQCFKDHGWLVSQVYLTTPPMSGEFIATGRGCWQAGSTVFTCVPTEPVRATL
jgi:hypothetical protein